MEILDEIMENSANNANDRNLRSQSMQIIQMPMRMNRQSEVSITPSLERSLQSDSMTGNNDTNGWDPLKILIPITDGVLIIMAVIFILALAMVAMIVVLAIIKVYFKDGKIGSLWTDEWF